MKTLKKLLACLLAIAVLPISIVPVSAQSCMETNTSFYAETLDLSSSAADQVHIFTSLDKEISAISPFPYSKLSEIYDDITNQFYIYVPKNYTADLLLPIQIESAGCLVCDFEYPCSDDNLNSNYSIYQDSDCTNLITTTDQVSIIPTSGTYYLKIPGSLLNQTNNSIISSFFGLITNKDCTLESDDASVSFLPDSQQVLYYQFKVTSSSRIQTVIYCANGGYVTLCNSQKTAITSKTYADDSEKKLIYTVKKGTYYLKITNATGLVYGQYSKSAVTDTTGKSKKNATVLKINGSTKTSVIYSDTSTKTGYFYKFTNTRSQKLYLNVTSSFSSGKMELELYNAKGKLLKKETLDNGVNQKASFSIYASSKLPKGTYYIKFTKASKKSNGLFKINIRNYK